MATMQIKKGDLVTVLSGSYKYRKGKGPNGEDLGVKKGEVIATSPIEGKLIVKDVAIIHKHVKPRRQGETGGIVDAEAAIYASKVALYCPKCDKGVRTHIEVIDGKKVRVCSKKGCGYKFD